MRRVGCNSTLHPFMGIILVWTPYLAPQVDSALQPQPLSFRTCQPRVLTRPARHYLASTRLQSTFPPAGAHGRIHRSSLSGSLRVLAAIDRRTSLWQARWAATYRRHTCARAGRRQVAHAVLRPPHWQSAGSQAHARRTWRNSNSSLSGGESPRASGSSSYHQHGP
jgi:hypothetical protein